MLFLVQDLCFLRHTDCHHLARDDYVLATAQDLLAELNRVLGYPGLRRYHSDEERTRFVALSMALSEVVDLPGKIPRICRDPDDDRVIACAVVGRHDVIVRGDDDLLDLEWVGGTPILMAAPPHQIGSDADPVCAA